MHLWNDYEGQTFANVFPLQRLLTTEGRSASFATIGNHGRPAVIRLTEALNDQRHMRQRYAATQAVLQPNLVRIEDFGDSELEGEPLVYLVTEVTEESLADILRERRLSIEETGEVALSLVGAIEALHANSLVHGLVEPASVLAAGDVIKLRSDCVRPAPSGIDGARAYAEDVFGVADVLNRALTQQRLVDASDALALPEPYASIVRNVVRGTWGIDQVASELRRHVRSAPGAQPIEAAAALGSQARLSPAPATASPTLASNASTVRVSSEEDPSFAEALAAANRVFDRATAAIHTPPGPPTSPQRSTSADAEVEPLPPRSAPATPLAAAPAPASETELPLSYAGTVTPETAHAGPRDPSRSVRSFPTVLVAAAVVVLVALFLLLTFARSGRETTSGKTASIPAPARAPDVPAPTQAAPAQPQPAFVQAAPSPVATAASAASAGLTRPARPAPDPAADAPAIGTAIWRVVAYTYNRQDQAEAKAQAIAARHKDLRVEVFSRTGQAPYLVTLGGPLSRSDAGVLRKRARNEGMPRDVYVQNYSH